MKGQYIIESSPCNKFFNKIEIAKFPELKEKRGGVIFYKVDTSLYSPYIKSRINYIFKTFLSSYQKYKFKCDGYRYLNYSISLDSTFYSSNGARKEIDSKNVISINAFRYKRKFRFSHMEFELRLKDTICIYQGVFYFRDSLVNSKNNLIKRLITKKDSLALRCIVRSKYTFNGSIDTNKINNSIDFSVNFDDCILYNEGISTMNPTDVYMMPDYDYIGSCLVFYFAVIL